MLSTLVTLLSATLIRSEVDTFNVISIDVLLTTSGALSSPSLMASIISLVSLSFVVIFSRVMAAGFDIRSTFAHTVVVIGVVLVVGTVDVTGCKQAVI